MWWFLLTVAFAAPPASASRVPCALDGLPEGEIVWTAEGELWLMRGKEIIVTSKTGTPVSGTVSVSCSKTRALLVMQDSDGTTFGYRQIDADFAEVLASLVETPPPPPDQVAMALEQIVAAIVAGRIDDAATWIRQLDPKDERVKPAWGTVGRAALSAAVRDGTMPVDVERWLSLAEEAAAAGALTAEERLRIRIERAVVALDSGRTADGMKLLEAIVAEAPAEVRAWLLLGDARWAQLDKKGARLAYAEVCARSPAAERPAELATRAKKECRVR